MNSDASWNESLNLWGIGWIIRDSSGSLIGSGIKQVGRKWNIKSMEALAIKEGLKAYNQKISSRKLPVIVEADAMELVKSLNLEASDISESEVVVNEVIALTPEAGVVCFSKCPKRGNLVAHSLARAAAGFPSVSSLPADVVERSCNSLIFYSSSTLEIDFVFGRDDSVWLTSLIEDDFCISAFSFD